jgi:hypothetical protein
MAMVEIDESYNILCGYYQWKRRIEFFIPRLLLHIPFFQFYLMSKMGHTNRAVNF